MNTLSSMSMASYKASSFAFPARWCSQMSECHQDQESQISLIFCRFLLAKRCKIMWNSSWLKYYFFHILVSKTKMWLICWTKTPKTPHQHLIRQSCRWHCVDLVKRPLQEKWHGSWWDVGCSFKPFITNWLSVIMIKIINSLQHLSHSVLCSWNTGYSLIKRT